MCCAASSDIPLPQTGTGTTLYPANNGEFCNLLSIKGRGDQDFTQNSKSAPHNSEYELSQADFLSLNSKGHKLLIYLS